MAISISDSDKEKECLSCQEVYGFVTEIPHEDQSCRIDSSRTSDSKHEAMRESETTIAIF